MSEPKRVLVTTVPFAERDPRPRQLLERGGAHYTVNPLNRRLREDELAEMLDDIDVVIAGTEPITDKVLARANRLRLISRVGVGLDSVDLLSAKRRGINVSYTPEAPAPAVAELTIGLIFSALRCIPLADRQIRGGLWARHAGRRLAECTVGIIGVGRIGSRVLRHLSGFSPRQILLNDLCERPGLASANVRWASKEEIIREADVLSLHLPLTAETRNLLTRTELLAMKGDALVINTSRGGIINEADLAQVLADGHLGGAGIDVFENEPYDGPLAQSERCVLTAHMGSMAVDCRARMELEATEEVIRFIRGEPLAGLVPPAEFEARQLIASGS